MKRVQVDWLDISGGPDNLDVWADRDTILDRCKPIMCSTVGWILEKTKHRLLMASSRTDEEPPHYSDLNVIPRACIKRITDLPDPAPKPS